MAFCPLNNEDWGNLSESGHLTFRVSENHYTDPIFQGQEHLFSFKS